ncbi:hypothetical protein KO02_10930 [Sphingobacterium sp. ML3W]|uniref:RagB/SusD family nutrient uptake outer membrane protein n=1 Tax=Sphingobacterium sp. ML3W TaxID=1538644 RepID=UPI0004F6A4AB|nr:RagB/SusD family nutrient uptake outer membrane protein [Sphingobacterium sp. ML3W]AIM37145.1 hypothetical protein KO02_10930 [Sphingobacterium sp. ML3W]
MKRVYLSLLLGLLTLGSCSKYLDIKPKGFTIPEYIKDYQLLLNSSSLIASTPGYPVFLTDDLYSGDRNDVQSGARYDYYSYLKKQLYSFAHGAVLEDGQTDTYWETAYSRIFTYNVIINNILKASDGTDIQKRRIWAEALIGRAFEYLNLVNMYGAHYNVKTASTDLGVPMVLAEDVNASYERVSVQAVYDQVALDVNDALPYLNEVQANKFQAMRSVGFSFLSRSHLYQGNYKEALSNAKQALALNDNLIDYSLYTNKDKTTWGRVCLKTDDLVEFPDLRTSPERIWAKKGTSSDGAFNAEFYASKDLIQTYANDLPADAVDKRYELFFCRDRASFGPNEVKFPGRVLFAPYVDFNMGFGSAELFLIAAECEARLGDATAAVAYLNMLRASRIENYSPLVVNDARKVLQITLDERRRELPFMASHRLIDLKRLAVTGDLKKTIQHPLEDEMFEMESTDLRMILPVPPKVLSLNPEIPQYER